MALFLSFYIRYNTLYLTASSNKSRTGHTHPGLRILVVEGQSTDTVLLYSLQTHAYVVRHDFEHSPSPYKACSAIYKDLTINCMYTIRMNMHYILYIIYNSLINKNSQSICICVYIHYYIKIIEMIESIYICVCIWKWSSLCVCIFSCVSVCVVCKFTITYVHVYILGTWYMPFLTIYYILC